MTTLAVAALAITQYIASDVPLQPFACASPSGEWSLSVNPSARDGAGSSVMTLSKRGKVQWTGEKPFTFREAVLDDAGICAGYAYTGGLHDDDGVLAVAVIGGDGVVRLFDETPRRSCSGSDGPPEPIARRIVLHPDRDVAIVCVADLDEGMAPEAWCEYQLTSAKKLGIARPSKVFEDEEQHYWTSAIAPVRGTELMLAQWACHDWDGTPPAGPGLEYSLYDASGALVWTLPLPGDLRRDDEDEEDVLWDEMRDSGFILDARQERRFEVRHVAKGERVTYEVARDPDAKTGWAVREVARAPFVAKPDDGRARPKALTLPLVGSFELDVRPATSGPVRDIQTFDLGPDGSITFVRGEEVRHAVTLVTLDSTGAVQRQVAIPPIEARFDGVREWHPLSVGQWLLTISPWEGEERVSRAWRIDGATGAIAELTDFQGPPIDAVVPAPDGGFVMLGTHPLEYTSQSELRRCDASGATIWSHREIGYGQCDSPSDLCSPEDVAVDDKGAVFVLDNSRKLLQCFDPDGRYVRSVEFANAWNTESSYLTSLLLEPSGTFLVGDHDDAYLSRRIRTEGAMAETIRFRMEGTGTDAGTPVRVDPMGRLWGHDGHQFLEYGADGIVRERFGTPADPTRMGVPEMVFHVGGGRFALVDHRTHVLHVFATNGTRAQICVPGGADVGGVRSIDAVVASPGGRILAQGSRYDDRYLAFAPDGERLGIVELGGERVAFERRSNARWTLAHERFAWIRLRHFDTEGKLVLETDRRPDGGFFESAGAVACAPDGTVVVLELSSEHFEERPTGLCLYGPNGEPRQRIVLPETEMYSTVQLEAGRRWIVISCYDGTALLVSRDGSACFTFRAAEADDEWLWAFGLSPDEREIWALHSSTQTVHRFTLPK